MASGNRTITIRIISEDQKAAPSPDPKDNQPGGKETPSPKASNASSKEKSKSLFAEMHLASKAKDFVIQEAEYYTGKYLAVTENYRMQTAIQNAKSFVNGAFSIYASAKAGAVAGSAAGPAGAAAGAAIGATLAIANKVQSAISENYDAYQAIIDNAYSNYFYSERAGFASGGYGTEN